jgi:hypothetical protein
MRLARLTAALVASVLLAPPLPAAPPSRSTDPVLEMLLVMLDLEKKRAAEDIEEFDRIAGRVSRAENDVARAVERLSRLVRDGGGDRAAIETAEDEIAHAEAAVIAERERRRLLAARLVERARNAVSLREEIAKRREAVRIPSDPLTGRWDVFINPGSRRGIYRLVLDGTLVSGDYVLDGGFRGSLRGTLIGDRVNLQRIDAERGFDATFYGRLAPGPTPAQKRITGTWEATMIAPATGPTAGTWSALPSKEPDESEKQ